MKLISSLYSKYRQKNHTSLQISTLILVLLPSSNMECFLSKSNMAITRSILFYTINTYKLAVITILGSIYWIRNAISYDYSTN